MSGASGVGFGGFVLFMGFEARVNHTLHCIECPARAKGDIHRSKSQITRVTGCRMAHAPVGQSLIWFINDGSGDGKGHRVGRSC